MCAVPCPGLGVIWGRTGVDSSSYTMTAKKTNESQTRQRYNKKVTLQKHKLKQKQISSLTAFFLASGSKRSRISLAFLYVSVSITSSSWRHKTGILWFFHAELITVFWSKHKRSTGNKLGQNNFLSVQTLNHDQRKDQKKTPFDASLLRWIKENLMWGGSWN